MIVKFHKIRTICSHLSAFSALERISGPYSLILDEKVRQMVDKSASEHILSF